MSFLLLGGRTAIVLRGSESNIVDNSNIHHQGAAQRIRTNPVQTDLERLSACTGFGEKMANYMSRVDIDFDTVDYEDENE